MTLTGISAAGFGARPEARAAEALMARRGAAFAVFFRARARLLALFFAVREAAFAGRAVRFTEFLFMRGNIAASGPEGRRFLRSKAFCIKWLPRYLQNRRSVRN
ncbi:MAG TPA: hypothetical protein VFL51_14485 [Pseudolabrys sp.]|nr:hypothetical protein [Pseudolabrys sp.]